MNAPHRARPPLANLETVCLVARHGSFTAAAEASGLTHGAISRRVGAVENWLGCALFERHGRGVSLTCDGQRFLGRIEHAFDVIDAAADQWHQARKAPAVRLSVVPSFAKLWLLERLQSLEAGQPFINIQVATEHRNADVGAGEVDIALRYGRGGWSAVDSEPLMAETLYPVASPEVAARLMGASASDMLAMPLLHDSDLTGWRAWCGAQGVSLRPRARDRRFEDYTVVLAAAEAGLGIALARAPLADAAIAKSRLRRLSDTEVECPLSYHIVTAKREKRPEVLEVIARLHRAAQAGSRT
ncbi:LysR family transcriptional regulator [Pandoraea nosoerga]|uniref:LysR substrate-binding domain-containing protein n=1 Tax=Pandoraea nosoerga TaxID=2508296 RepID=UPI00197CDEE0|nr:LysR substrate-binding domain-containing protein [Pandoraea nosoerga]MBN4664484.1 LysR family transcriptional regulator [Pandoraea nosoerga]MBN4674480.1 LysR family transcriptional regulator [Pandoraea nosoerga]MBN4679748.1 LysR family transcriptional regulator [Pandoraea nosoerga]MBN4743164.1 LysR family transcriptional regulator [Pandoraea nosoerga]